VGFDVGYRLGGIVSLYEKGAINALDLVNGILVKTASFESYGIDADVGKRITGCLDVGWYVFANERAATDHSMCADFDELVYDAVFANQTIVCDVYVSHEHGAVIYCGSSAFFGATIEGAILADDNVVTDFEGGLFALKFEVLRNRSNYRTRKYFAVFAYPRTVHNGYMRPYPRTRINRHVTINSHERTDAHIIGNLCIGVNIC